MEKWKHYSSFLPGLVLVVGALAWIVVPSAAFAKGPPDQNPGQPFAEILAAIANLQGEGNHTLRWDQVLDSIDGDPTTGCNSSRFKCIMPTAANLDGEAVLDKATGLVWERVAGDTDGDGDVDFDDRLDWTAARFHCANKAVGGLKGWKLPSFDQLASLVDPSVSAPGPTLPQGHPFIDVQSSDYWSASTDIVHPTFAWYVVFGFGNVLFTKKTSPFFVWCVRSGQSGPDAY